MAKGSKMFLVTRGANGSAVIEGDLVTVLEIYAAMALVERNGQQFRVMLADLR